MSVDIAAEDFQIAQKLLCELIAIPSPNITGDQAKRDKPEKRVAAFLAKYLSDMSMEVDVVEVQPGRPNVIAHWPDQNGERSLALEAHMDTVGVDGMTDPFKPKLEGGKILGRGSCDTKGSIAAFITAMRLMRKRGIKPADKIYFVATMGEETGDMLGAKALMDSGFKPDAFVVGEPTRCQVVSAHKGLLWVELQAHGCSGHASAPRAGQNAIVPVARAVDIIESKFSEQLQSENHPLLGRATVSTGKISGGTKTNIIPDFCSAQIDIRTLPSHDQGKIVESLRELINSELPDESKQLQITPTCISPAFETAPDAPLIRNFLAACNQSKPQGVSYGTDASRLSISDSQVIVFGPGDIAQAHTTNEFLELDQLNRSIQILLTLLSTHQKTSLLD